MNKAQSRGQKWFWFALILCLSPHIWELSLLLWGAIAEPNSDVYLNYLWKSGFIEKEVVIIVFIVGSFLLINRGYSWIKWIYVSLTVIVISVSIVISFVKYTNQVLGPIAQNRLFIDQLSLLIFNLIPVLILVFSTPCNAFLHYKYLRRNGQVDATTLEQQLNQIGTNE